jgi:hypothetical protein
MVRFQTQRLREARRGAKFALSDAAGEGELLTHGGISLADLEDLNEVRERPAPGCRDA